MYRQKIFSALDGLLFEHARWQHAQNAERQRPSAAITGHVPAAERMETKPFAILKAQIRR